MGQGGPSGLGPSHIHPIHPGPLYLPAGPLTPRHSGCTRNSKYPLSNHHFRTGLPGLLTLGIPPGMQNWALCYIYLLLLLPSLLSHPSFCPCCHCCVSQSNPQQRDDVLGQTVITHEEHHRQSLTPRHSSGPQSPFSHRTHCGFFPW